MYRAPTDREGLRGRGDGNGKLETRMQKVEIEN
jgi:hypothetical protein